MLSILKKPARAAVLLSVVAAAIFAAVTATVWQQPLAVGYLPVASAAPQFAAKATVEEAYTAQIDPTVVRDFARLPAQAAYGLFVQFAHGTVADHAALLKSLHIDTVASFEQYAQSVYAFGPVLAFQALAHEPMVSRLEENQAISFFGDTSGWASRARVAQEAVSGGPYYDAQGRTLTGEGVGVAVVDTGVDGNHVDLKNNIAKNYKIICSTGVYRGADSSSCAGSVVVQETADTDTTGGHGTHVSGIVAGDGTASTAPYGPIAPNILGTYTGIAPKAKLYGFSVGDGSSILYVNEAFQYVLDHYDEFTPRIKIINNSYGVGPDKTTMEGFAYDPNSTVSKLVKSLVNKGVTLVYAAGNDAEFDPVSGQYTTHDRTTPTCKDTTPGVICAASYNDADATATSGSGSIEGKASTFSSQGKQGTLSTYPDIAAPGDSIISTCNNAKATCAEGTSTSATTTWAPNYTTLSGTSMASPHIAGIVALMLQARPDLTPAAIEKTLLETARKVNDPAVGGYASDSRHPGSTTNFVLGAGLVNAPAALDALGVTHGSSTSGSSAANTASAKPQVGITQPQAESSNDGSTPLPRSGSANDAVPPPVTPTETVLFSGDNDPILLKNSLALAA